MPPQTLIRAKTLADAASDVKTVEFSDPDGKVYSSTPRGCKCIGGPIRDGREPWFVVCIKCGAVLNTNGSRR